jgi:hypothetical protein
MELQTKTVQIEKIKKLGAQTQNAPQVTKTHKQDAFKPEEYQKQKQNKTKKKKSKVYHRSKSKRKSSIYPRSRIDKTKPKPSINQQESGW